MNIRGAEEFLKSGYRNQWVHCGSYSVYLRRGKRRFNDELVDCFDIANVENRESLRGKGKFRPLILQLVALAKTHQFQAVLIESVINERLLPVFPELGFSPIPNSEPPSFYARIS